MYPLPEQPEPKTATLRPLPNVDAAGPIPLSAPLPAELLTTGPMTTEPLASGPLATPLAEDMLPTVPGARPGVPGPAYPGAAPAPGPGSWVPDVEGQRARIGADMDGLRSRAEAASSWLASSRHYSRLINRQGVVPVSARMSPGDLAFLAEAREQILQFTELTGRLIDLHQPLDAGGITTDPSSPIRRCRSCMWRWPCPTFSILAEVVDRPPSA
jgi:hypothetical protein